MPCPIDPDRLLPHARIPEWPGLHEGKVRDSYDLADGRRLLIASDRISAFDRILAVVPYKGQVLTQVARFWFESTADICPNHVLSYPDANALLAKRLTILPVEMVVRGYLAGNTSTSILTQYKKGRREMYGHRLPDGMRDNQALPRPIITPTSKAEAGAHDAPLTPDEILAQGLLTPAQWEELCAHTLALFAHGQKVAAARGLILADTKYEFGIDAEGRIHLADEIHTPDSSRYWLAKGYERAFEEGTRPPSFDKDILRAWVEARCDPYRDPVPEIPAELIMRTATAYVEAFEAITAAPFTPDLEGASVIERVRAHLAAFFAPPPANGAPQ